jgi:uncharacterized protein (TIGR01777 family)
MPTFIRSIDLPHPRDAVWAWHLRPGALTRLTPPYESAELLRHDGIHDGARVKIRTRILPGVTLDWTVDHHDVVPPERFRDRMISGPFARWDHLHQFDVTPEGTRNTDAIDWAAPFGPLGAIGEGAVTARLGRMFRYRQTTLAADLDEHARAGGRRLRVAITGASGLLGRQLSAFLTTGGHQVTPLVRRTPRSGEIQWDPAGSWDATQLSGYDAVIHLAGEGIADGRWSEGRKAAIRASRGAGTRNLVSQLARLTQPPGALISASAMGYYGSRGDEELTERSSNGNDFLAQVVQEWEAGAQPLQAAGTRIVHLRFGVLLSPAGGALARMLPPFLAGVGGTLADGKQWMSWLALDDAIYLIHRAILDPRYAGPINAVSPTPGTNRDLTRTLGRILRRPTLFPVPRPALRLLFGELADGAILASQRVIPERLKELGFTWKYPDLDVALRHLLSR